MNEFDFILGAILVLLGGFGIGAAILWMAGQIGEMFDDEGGWE